MWRIRFKNGPRERKEMLNRTEEIVLRTYNDSPVALSIADGSCPRGQLQAVRRPVVRSRVELHGIAQSKSSRPQRGVSF